MYTLTTLITRVYLGYVVLILALCNVVYWTPSHATSQYETYRLNIDETGISVSGLSSGAFLATQMHIAFSKTFMGMAAVAGCPYYCALDNVDVNVVKARCMTGEVTPGYIDDFINATDAAAKAGLVDATSNIANARVYIFNSENDQVINPGLGALNVLYYKHYGVSGDTMVAKNTVSDYGPTYIAAHGLPTNNKYFLKFLDTGILDDQGFPCAPSNSQQNPWFPNPFLKGNDPWLYYCDYPNNNTPIKPGFSMVYEFLNHIYNGALTAHVITDPPPPSAFTKIAQLQYVSDKEIKTVAQLNGHGLGEFAYIYVPQSCKDGHSCKLHVALHGCQQYPEWQFQTKETSNFKGQKLTFNDTFYRLSDYVRIADGNNMVVLFPQAHNIGTDANNSINPYGCWEFWPFFTKDQDSYYTQNGRAMAMIKNMVDSIISGLMITRPE